MAVTIIVLTNEYTNTIHFINNESNYVTDIDRVTNEITIISVDTWPEER